MIDRIDRNAAFGNCASGQIWCLFFGLVAWIGINWFAISNLLLMDDCWSFEFAQQLVYYASYDEWYPTKQVQLFRLFDVIGIPHKKPKQLFGKSLTVIGFLISLEDMTITMPSDKKADVVLALRTFIKPESSRQQTLCEFSKSLATQIGRLTFSLY